MLNKPQQILNLENQIAQEISIYTTDMGEDASYAVISDNKVTQLFLSDLDKNIDLQSFTELTTLGLENYQLPTLEIIKHNAGLNKLVLFPAANLDLSGIEQLSNLEILHIDNAENEVALSNYGTLAQLPNLKHLEIYDASGLTAKHLQNITNCTFLSLVNIKIHDLEFIKEMKNLEVLRIEKSYISDISPLTDIIKLKELILSSSKIQDISAISHLTHLQELDLHHNNLSNISGITKLQKLKNLNISQNNIKDIQAIASLSQLEFLYASDNSISDISSIEKLKDSLHHIDFAKNKITDLSLLKSIPNIRYLNIANNPAPDKENIRDYLQEYSSAKKPIILI